MDGVSGTTDTGTPCIIGGSDSAPDFESFVMEIHPLNDDVDDDSQRNSSSRNNYNYCVESTTSGGDDSGREKPTKKRVSDVDSTNDDDYNNVIERSGSYFLDMSTRSHASSMTTSSRSQQILKFIRNSLMLGHGGGITGSSGRGGGKTGAATTTTNTTTTTTTSNNKKDNGKTPLSTSLGSRKTTIFKSPADLMKTSKSVRKTMGFVLEEDDDDDEANINNAPTNHRGGGTGFEAVDLLDANKPTFALGDPINDSSTCFGRSRNCLGAFINNRWVQNLSTFLIILNAIVLGALTYVYDNPSATSVLEKTDLILLVLFTIEVVTQLIYLGIIEFGKNWWLVFDGLIIGISWIFLDSPLSIFRSFRIFRLFALVSRWKSLRRLFKAVGRTMPKMATIAIALLLFFYVFCVMFTSLYYNLWEEGYLDYDYFGRLDYTFLTLFQMMTLDSWTYVVRQVMEKDPFCWLGFMVWVIITAFFVMNLVVAVICESLIELQNMADESQKNKQFEHQQKLMEAQKQEMVDQSRQVLLIQNELLANQVAIGTTLVDIMKHLKDHHHYNNPYVSATASAAVTPSSTSSCSVTELGSKHCDIDIGSMAADGHEEEADFEDIESPPVVGRNPPNLPPTLPRRSIPTSSPSKKKNHSVKDICEKSLDLDEIFPHDKIYNNSRQSTPSSVSVQQMLESSSSDFAHWSSNLDSTITTSSSTSSLKRESSKMMMGLSNSSLNNSNSYSSPFWTGSLDTISGSMRGTTKMNTEITMSIVNEDDEDGYSSSSLRDGNDDDDKRGMSHSPPRSPNNVSKTHEEPMPSSKSCSVGQSTEINKSITPSFSTHSEATMPPVSDSTTTGHNYSTASHFARRSTQNEGGRVAQTTADYEEDNDNNGSLPQYGGLSDNEPSPTYGILNANETSHQDGIIDNPPSTTPRTTALDTTTFQSSSDDDVANKSNTNFFSLSSLPPSYTSLSNERQQS